MLQRFQQRSENFEFLFNKKQCDALPDELKSVISSRRSSTRNAHLFLRNLNRISTAAGKTFAWVIFALMLALCVDVVRRYVFKNPSQWGFAFAVFAQELRTCEIRRHSADKVHKVAPGLGHPTDGVTCFTNGIPGSAYHSFHDER